MVSLNFELQFLFVCFFLTENQDSVISRAFLGRQKAQGVTINSLLCILEETFPGSCQVFSGLSSPGSRSRSPPPQQGRTPRASLHCGFVALWLCSVFLVS